jgi:hypothetical protein
MMNFRKAELPRVRRGSEMVKKSYGNNPIFTELSLLLFILSYTIIPNSFLIYIFNLDFCIGFSLSIVNYAL